MGLDDLSALDESALNAAIIETAPSQTLSGIEEILANMGINYIYGTGADETLNGTVGDDEINGYGGNDTLLGHSGDDLLYAGAGNDALVGGTGNDGLFGETGADTYLYEYGFDAIQNLTKTVALLDKIVMSGDYGFGCVHAAREWRRSGHHCRRGGEYCYHRSSLSSGCV